MFFFCAEFCFLPFPFRKKSWGKNKQTQPAPRSKTSTKHSMLGKVMLPFETPISDLLIRCLEKVRTHILLNGGHCWWWFIMVQSLNNHLLTKQIQVITKTKLQMGHLNSIFVFWLFFFRGSKCFNFRPHRIIPCITPTSSSKAHPPSSAHARCLENSIVDLTLARPPVFAEKLSATHQLAWRFCPFFGEKRPFFWSGRVLKKNN